MCLMNLTSLTPLGRVSRAMGSPPLVLLLIPGSLGIQYLHAPKLPPHLHHCCPCMACALLIPYLLNRAGGGFPGTGARQVGFPILMISQLGNLPQIQEERQYI